MKTNPDYTLRDIAGETIIVNQGSSHTDMTRIISLNASARLLWENLEGRDFTLADAVQVLVGHYGIDPAQAEADAARWVEQMEACGGVLRREV